MRKIAYVAVRQSYSHDFVCVDLHEADRLPRANVFRLDCELCDEAVDALWQVPGDHDEGVVLSVRCQIGHQAGGCRKYTSLLTCGICFRCWQQKTTHVTRQFLCI